MKKIAVFLAVLTLLLYACGGAPSEAEQNNEPDMVVESTGLSLTDEKIIELVEDDWYYMMMTAVDSFRFDSNDTEEYAGETYYRVIEEGFETWDEFEAFVESVYTPNVAEYKLFMISEFERTYVNINGAVYCRGGGGRGIDVSREFTHKVIKSTPTEATVEVYREYIFDDVDGYETTVYNFEMTLNGWRIANDDTSKVVASEEEVIALLEKEAFIYRALYCGGLSSGGAAEVIDGYEYYPVTDPDFDDWQEWVDYVESVYSNKYTIKDVLSNPTVIKVGDKTYIDGGGRGYDLSDDFEWHQVLSRSPSSSKVFGIAYNPYVGGDGGKKTGYDLKLTSAGWRIESVY